MIVKALVLNKLGLGDLLASRPNLLARHPVISIGDPGEERLLPHAHPHLLNLAFYDIDPAGLPEDVRLRYPSISAADADSVVSFLRALPAADKSQVLIVQCHAGIARSGAVASFAVDLLGLDREQFQSDNPLICPNEYVLSQLHQALSRV